MFLWRMLANVMINSKRQKGNDDTRFLDYLYDRGHLYMRKDNFIRFISL